MYPHHHTSPCLHCHPHSYIRMVDDYMSLHGSPNEHLVLQVQSLIERCLILRMDRDQCIKALAEHARIRPLITLTVWRELMKENKDFFQAYFHAMSPRPLTSGRIHKAPNFGRRKQWK